VFVAVVEPNNPPPAGAAEAPGVDPNNPPPVFVAGAAGCAPKLNPVPVVAGAAGVEVDAPKPKPVLAPVVAAGFAPKLRV